MKIFIRLKDLLRSAKNSIRRGIFRSMEACFRVHVTPVHFYSPIPEVGRLRPEVYTKLNKCVGLDFGVPGQLETLAALTAAYADEYTPGANSGLAQVDAFFLYTLIRSKKPAKVVEIGSGESTKISLAALEKNRAEGSPGRLVAVEPYPKDYLQRLVSAQFELIEAKVEDLEVDLLTDADMLFIDSSHVAKIGSDVNYEMFNLIPRLKVGALVHWHDIMIPGDYPQTWIEEGNKFWNESYLLHAFMLFNPAFKIRWASKYMQLNHSGALRAALPYFAPQDPDQQLSSFWVERIA